MVRLAGVTALGLAGLLTPSAELGCRQDLREAKAYALDLAEGCEARAEQIVSELRVKTRRLVFERDRSREHGAVTITLLERETLSASELRQVRYAANLRRKARD
jgi:hypothetical protein